MFANACRIFDSYNDKDLRRIKDTVRESSSWSQLMKSGRHLSRVVAGEACSSRQGRPADGPARKASLEPGDPETAERVAESWKRRFAGCGAELGSDGLRRSLQGRGLRKPRAVCELERAMASVSPGKPFFGEPRPESLPLTEAEIRRQSQEKYERVAKSELRDFLTHCHEQSLRAKNHIKINWKLEEVYRIKEDNFLAKLQVQSSRYHRPPKEPFICDPRRPKHYKGLVVQWRAKPAARRPPETPGGARPARLRREPSQPDRSQTDPDLAAKARLAKTSSARPPQAPPALSPAVGSVREFSLLHLLDGQAGGPYLLRPKEQAQRGGVPSGRNRSSRSINLQAGPSSRPPN